jgi:hypothetical protein
VPRMIRPIRSRCVALVYVLLFYPLVPVASNLQYAAESAVLEAEIVFGARELDAEAHVCWCFAVARCDGYPADFE